MRPCRAGCSGCVGVWVRARVGASVRADVQLAPPSHHMQQQQPPPTATNATNQVLGTADLKALTAKPPSTEIRVAEAVPDAHREL